MSGDINTGFDMWQDYKNQYGVITARIMCLRYLDLQARTTDEYERAFCRELREAMTMERNMKDEPYYKASFDYARSNGEDTLFYDSETANIMCANEINDAIRACEYGDGSHKLEPAIQAILEQYGAERPGFVLALEVRRSESEFSTENQMWSRSFDIQSGFASSGVMARSDVLNEFITCFRETLEQTRAEEHGAVGHAQPYDNGADYWRDLKEVSVNLNAALAVGGKYIGEKAKVECTANDKQFCRELFAAMYVETAGTADKFMTIYPHDYSTAYSSGEDSLFTQSRERNESCATRIDYLINASQFKSQYYNLELAAMRAVHDYGFDRVNMVLARNIQARYSDGRFSSSNKQWARDVQFPEQAFESAILNAHPILIEYFNRYTRKLYDEVGAEHFTRREREENGEPSATADDKLSVLEQIRNAQKNPPMPRGEKTAGHRKNKDEAEH